MTESASRPDVAPANAAASLPSAPVWRRLAALVYDGFLLFALLFAAAALYQFATQYWSGAFATVAVGAEGVIHDLTPAAHGPVFQLYLGAVIAAFYCYFWRRTGQTLGMQAWRLRLDSATGGRPGLLQCLRRLAAAVPALLLAGAGYWWIWLDRDRLAWHDRLSATRVRVLPPRT